MAALLRESFPRGRPPKHDVHLLDNDKVMEEEPVRIDLIRLDPTVETDPLTAS